MKIKSHSDRQPVTGGVAAAIPGCRGAGASSPAERDVIYSVRDRAEQSALLPKRLALRPPHSAERGIALVITLIMLAITLVMAVAFLAIAHRERASVDTQRDTEVARLAADSALANAEAQIVSGMLSGPSNAYNLRLLVSTNYINPYGFYPAGGANPTNVNYNYLDGGGAVSGLNLEQNISNLWFLPRAPVYIPQGQPVTNYNFRYYLDLNENGQYDTNGWLPVTSGNPSLPYYDTNGNPVATYNPANVQNNFFVGDPEWIGMLEHPDAPHGPNNHFTSRYAFIAIPVGNSMDVNYLHNQAKKLTQTSFAANGGDDYYARNQGVGSWEINLAAFLADLNTNLWGRAVGSGAALPTGAVNYYDYQEPADYNRGVAFDDARAILAYRYNSNMLSSASSVFNNYNALQASAPHSSPDVFSSGTLQTNFEYTNLLAQVPSTPWSGSDNTNHFFTPDDFFNANNFIYSGEGINNNFATRLKSGGTNSNSSYDRYTYYRMLEELGTDSAADDGKLNLNYSNAVVTYKFISGVPVYQGLSVVTGAETNLMPWLPQNFFNAAADMLLRYYTTNWFQSNPTNFLETYYGIVPQWPVQPNGQGSPNYPSLGLYTNQIPAFGLTNLPVFVNGHNVYTPSVNRLLQLAANIYDASTNGPIINGAPANFPHVYRPVFERANLNGDVYIVGYTNVARVTGPYAGGAGDLQLQTPTNVTYLSTYPAINTPILQNGVAVNVYGVPWIIGAKKGFPAFNQFYLTNGVQVTRKLLFSRPYVGAPVSQFTTNQMISMAFSTGLGISFWNPYVDSTYNYAYPRPLKVFAGDQLANFLVASNSNGTLNGWKGNNNFYLNYNGDNTVTVPAWPGTQWSGIPPSSDVANANPLSLNSCILTGNWLYNFINGGTNGWSIYRFGPPYNSTFPVEFDPLGSATSSTWETTVPPLPLLPHFTMSMTNGLQAYVLDGNNVIDYVELNDPTSVGDLAAAMAERYPDPNVPGVYRQWATNGYPNAGSTLPYGVYNQYYVSTKGPNLAPPYQPWKPDPTFLSEAPSLQAQALASDQVALAEAAYFAAFFTPISSGGFVFDSGLYYNKQLQIEAPYTPSAFIFLPYLLQANDPLVHSLGSDLGDQVGVPALWGPNSTWQNGVWINEISVNGSLPAGAPADPIQGFYEPWGVQWKKQNQGVGIDTAGFNLTYRDPLAWGPEYWDFPTNLYATTGWLGRVHRGTPWQTVYLKASDILNANVLAQGAWQWANWTDDIQQDNGQYWDASLSAPVQDRLLFDIFTTRLNDNSVHGTLPVNAGAGSPDGGLADWSALLSGMVVLTNSNPNLSVGQPITAYSPQIINPAGTEGTNSAIGQIVTSIIAARANMPYQTFQHAGNVLATPALTEQSPFLNTNGVQREYGINDEMYEWLPQQMMGLVRSSEPRYVLYCFGQTLRPAPGGTVLNGPFFQMVTNYQVVAESAVRAVVHVDNSNTNNPHIVVESYNVLPPN